MVSIIKVTSVQDTSGNNETTTENIKKAYDGAAKVWVNFNGNGTIAIRDSHNVTSLADNGSGDYSVTFVNSMSNDDFAVSGVVGRDNYNCNFLLHEDDLSHNTNYVILFSATTSNQTGVDSGHVNAVVHGDLA